MGQIQTETPYYQPSPAANLPFPKNLTMNDPDFNNYCAPGSPPTCSMAFGLRVQASKNIEVYGAGLYSFFNNYSPNCSNYLNTTKCQHTLFAFDSAATTNLRVYNLNTVGASVMIQRDETLLASYGKNLNDYTSTVMFFESSQY